MSENEAVHRCACIVASSGDLVVFCGRYVRTQAPGVPLCSRHEVMGKRGSEVVYFIAWGSYIKVGTTKLDPKARLKAMTGDGTSKPQDVQGVPILLAAVLGNRSTEAAFHAVLAPYRAVGEWFRREGAVEALVNWIDSKYGIERGADLAEPVDGEPTPLIEGPSYRETVDF